MDYKTIKWIEGNVPGPTVAVMGSIHGNERIGGAIIEKLQTMIFPNQIKGKMVLIVGNPEAYEINKRFVDTDLNRLFTSLGVIKRKDPQTLNCEEKRVLEILPILSKADYLLDIHSTLKPSVPFIYCANTSKHLALAKLFSTPCIVSKSDDFIETELVSTADDYVNNVGGVGITFETGWHKDLSSIEAIVAKVKLFLYCVGSLTAKPAKITPAKQNISKHWLIYNHLIPVTPSFRFLKEFNNFDRIAAQELIAVDVGTVYSASKDSVIIFPKKDIVVGKSAGYLAVAK